MFIFSSEFSGGLRQTSVLSTINDSSHAAYKKLLNTAYKLAMAPSMLYGHFKVLVKCQRNNRVCLIQGCDNGRAAREFVSAIADAVREKVAAILVDAKFFTTLSDGSQAKKTRLDMELILTRTERNGIPVDFVTSLPIMSEFGSKYLCDLYDLT